jgi:hypothetical protein
MLQIMMTVAEFSWKVLPEMISSPPQMLERTNAGAVSPTLRR